MGIAFSRKFAERRNCDLLVEQHRYMCLTFLPMSFACARAGSGTSMIEVRRNMNQGPRRSLYGDTRMPSHLMVPDKPPRPSLRSKSASEYMLSPVPDRLYI